ncbi:hypothetical protein HY991_04035 [Candidatus Micrarchaeota archaeon]|nr:hypothetical protein [Candidatus Micrarchaeota archaeon]
MLLGIVFSLVSLLFGYALGSRLSFVNTLWKRFCFSLTIGMLAGAWLSFLLSWGLGSLGIPSISLTIIALSVSGRRLLKRRKKPTHHRIKINLPLVLLVFFSTLFLALNYFLVLHPNERGGADAIVNVWGDYGLHVPIINSFSLRTNFSPAYPTLAGHKLGYPFLSDFLASVLVVGGFSLRWALISTNVLLSIALVFSLYWLALEFTKNNKAAFIAVFLVLLNGNFGLVNAAKDLASGNFVLPPDKDYSHYEEGGLQFMNFIYSTFIPQRSTLFGIPLVFLVYLLLYRSYSAKLNPREKRGLLLLAGGITGLLPLVYMHSFLFAFGMALFLAVLERNRKWVWFFAPALAFAAPQLLFMADQLKPDIIGIRLGWMAKDKSLLGIAVFWIKNAWIPLLLSIPAFFLLDKKQKLFLIPFALIFIFANVVRVHPWEWDNIKFFFHWFVFACILTALFLVHFLKARKFFSVRNAALLFIVLFSVGSSILTFSWMLWGENARYEMISSVDYRAGAWVLRNTPQEAVFFTADIHNHPVSMVGGRQLVLGFRGHLWTHGVNYGEEEDAVKKVFCGEENDVVQTMREYNARYIFFGGNEENQFKCRHAFIHSKMFSKVYDADGDKIFELKD